MTFDSTTARDGQRRGTQTKKQRRLDLDRVDAELPPLVTPDDAKQRLDVLTRWAAAGLMSAGNAGAAVRGVEGWLRAHDAAVTQDKLRDAERTIKALKAALADAQKAGGLRRDA